MNYLLLLALSWFFKPETPNTITSMEIPSKEIASWFPDCEIGDTVKICIEVLYWRNGEGIPYSWVTPQPAGTAYGTPIEFNFWDGCGQCGIGGSGTQHVFYENLFEGESVQLEIVIGWALNYSAVWQAPSIVCGEPAPLGNGARFAIKDQYCNNYFYPGSPIGICPVTQFDCGCPTCPTTPPPDTSNYQYTPGFFEGCKIIYCPV